MASMYTRFLSLFLFCSVIASAQKQTTITTSKFLRDQETLVSSNGLFQIGFFSPGNSSNRYVGIWYNNIDSDTLEVTWIANRDNPLTDSSGVLKISEVGNLELTNGRNKTFWSSSNVSSNGGSIAQLEDTGNLVLIPSGGGSGTISWQSFDHPTNSLLPLMKLTIDKNTNVKQKLRSWYTLSDPSSGRFTCGLYLQNQLTEVFIWDGDRPYWRSGPWNSNVFIGVPAMNSVLLEGFSLVDDHQGKLSLSFSTTNQSNLIDLVLSSDGVLSQRTLNYDTRKLVSVWNSRESDCNIYGKCGSFGSCNSKDSPICGCLKGFEPKNKEEWSKGNWTSGCVRRTPLQCNSSTGTTDGFLKLRNMKVPVNAEWLSSNNEEDCGRQCLGKCPCLAYAYYSGIGCITWNNSLIDIQEFSINGADLFIRLTHSELGHVSRWKIILIVFLIVGTVALAFAAMYFLWRWMGRQKGKRLISEDKPVQPNKFNPNMSPVEIQDLPILTFEKLVIATNNFQEKNKLGQGGFGPVYKGNLEDGQEIAVKRLSRASGQGQQEFMNEVVLISKLQHINLVRLLGCCVEEDEKMLVYEYMPNKSLNAFLFDPLQKKILDWKKRFHIIEGICRGLLYLHRDSRLRIIHRDLKAGNILLDGDLNPKISDFGMARIFGRNEDQANTLRVVGTYGYMSPEYAMEGRFSEKSDVFSFGVLLLEIVSGRRVGSFDDDQGLSLLGYAWRLWNEDKIIQLIDGAICDSCFQVDFKRCIQVALLCVQEFPEERPPVSAIVSMLHCEIAALPRPKQPGFTQRRLNEFSQNGQQFNSVNHVSLSSINGR